MKIKNDEILIFGFCTEGPYRYVVNLLNNPECNWLPWSYNSNNIDSEVKKDLSEGFKLSKQLVAFASWSLNTKCKPKIIRFGKVDYSIYQNDILRTTIKLFDIANEKKGYLIQVDNPKILLFRTILEKVN